MSYTETHTGTIRKWTPPYGNDYNEWAEIYFEILKLKFEQDVYENKLEQIIDSTSYFDDNHLMFIGDEIYQIEDIEYDDGDLMQIYENEDGSYNYITQFYNGGTYLEEVLRDGLKDYKNNIDNKNDKT